MIVQIFGEIFICFDSKFVLIIVFDGECVMFIYRVMEISMSMNIRIYVYVVGKFECCFLDLIVWLVWIVWQIV